MALVAVAIASLFMSSCSDDLDVQRLYPFTVEVISYSENIAKGQIVELRLEIKPEGNYASTLYTIRYFQYEGEGTLILVDGPVLTNNDRVLLESKTFLLSYTAKSDGQHKIPVVVEDSFNSTPWEQTFEFNTKDSDGDSMIAKFINPGIVTLISQ